jgi:hypothetical protein
MFVSFVSVMIGAWITITWMVNRAVAEWTRRYPGSGCCLSFRGGRAVANRYNEKFSFHSYLCDWHGRVVFRKL